MPTEEVYIGIGSNLTNPISIVEDAINCLGKISESELIKCSSLYRSEPVSDIPQDDYVNAVVAIRTNLQPTYLLLELQAIEHAFYRQRDPDLKWAPRTLDLDIILYGNRIIHDSHLTVPHPEMSKRLFVLKPLLELSGDLYISGHGSLSYLIDQAIPIEIHKISK
jgi:2-amino-4-hydroxy-6-hydroxymethyldihydropteridine diphosphokinase